MYRQRIKIGLLDKLFSLYIRQRDNFTCQRCFKQFVPPTSGLHCSHFHGRRKKSVRWDERNAVSFCHGCHVHMTENPEEHRAFFLALLGQKNYDRLMLDANMVRKPDTVLIGIKLREKLKLLDARRKC